MLTALTRAVLMVLATVSLVACGDESPKDSDTSDDTRPKPEVSVPATTEALTVLFRTMLEDVRSGNDKRVGEALTSMTIGDPAAFFAEHFPEEVAKQLAADYPAKAEHLPELGAVLRSQLDKGRDQIVVEKFDNPDDGKAVGYQSAALKAMTTKTTLYSVRLRPKNREQGFHLWSFVHDGSRFRWVGKLRAILPTSDSRQDRLLQLRVDRAAQVPDR